MQIIEKDIGELTPYEQNPRKNAEAVKYVANSIKEFGFKVPVVIDKDNVIVAGHTRLLAAKKLKMKTVPCIIADDLTDEQVKAFRLADNKTAEFAAWDNDLLALELVDLSLDMTQFGFENLELPKEVVEDDAPAVEETTTTKRGDIFILGEHRLMCGDSTDAGDVALLMDGEKAKVLFTSPPYSDIRTYRGGKNLDTVHLSNFIKAYRPYCEYQIVNLGLQWKESEIYPYWDDYIALAKECGYKLIAWNVWDKGSAISIGAQQQAFAVVHEWIFVFGDAKPELNKTVPKKAASVYNRAHKVLHRMKDGSTKFRSAGDTSSALKKIESIARINAEHNNATEWKQHPARFPVKLPSEYIQAMTNEGDAVIDCFGGSGTTLVACEELNRKCRMMEIDALYCDVIVKRWENLTGGKAKKIGVGAYDATQ